MAHKADKKTILEKVKEHRKKAVEEVLKDAADWDVLDKVTEDSSKKAVARSLFRKRIEDAVSGMPTARSAKVRSIQPSRRVTANDFQQRWGGSGRDDFTMIPNALLENKERLELTDGQMMALLYLIKHWWYPPHDRNPFPRVGQLAKLMWKKERQVQRILAELQAHETPVKNGWSDTPGYIYREKRERDDGGQRSNEFDLSGLVNAVRALNAERQEAKEKQNTRVPAKPK